MKTILALLALLSISAFAQSVRGTPPDYCKPCLFYGGDFDPNGPFPNAVDNMHTVFQDAAVYVPFYIPAGQTWTITGLFSNNVTDADHINPKQIVWSISSGISTGNPGTLIASGTAYATWAPTGRNFNGSLEYTAVGHLTPKTAVALAGPGVYWMTAVPVCTNPNACNESFYAITDVEDVPAPNHKGVQPNDDSYVWWPNGDLYFEPTQVACGVGGCDKFSAGLLGYAKPSKLLWPRAEPWK